MKNEKTHSSPKRSTFSGKLGYVLATAGSAVGLGNIWRFPYLAAQHGGGIFLIVYLMLMVTFGYAFIVSETALGRMTKKSAIGAFTTFGESFPYKFGGWINALIPILILSYYCVIGGWVGKYLFEYIKGNVAGTASDTFFSDFTALGSKVEIWFVVFTLITMSVIFMGVNKGIEKVSFFMMPTLVILAIFITIYSVTRPGAVEGVKYFLIPDFKHFSIMTVVSAMGQMFYSLSVAMGILYTYGSYLKKDVDIEKTTQQVEIFDTAIAILAGLMIIPAVFAFSGGDPSVLKSGPSLMFVTIPKVFADMGFGQGAGILFFLLVLFAALTSSISLAETSASAFQDQFGLSRNKSALLTTVIILVLGTFSALGFNVLGNITPLNMDILSFMDFITNSVMMPIAAIATCVLILKAVSIEKVVEEVETSSKFKRKKMYMVFMKYFSIICVAIILVSSIANAFGFIKL